MNFLYHYLYQDLYTPLWPNIAASGILGLGGFLYGRAFEKRAIMRHNDMKEHITKHFKTKE